jgi:hypothetical protein
MAAESWRPNLITRKRTLPTSRFGAENGHRIHAFTDHGTSSTSFQIRKGKDHFVRP